MDVLHPLWLQRVTLFRGIALGWGVEGHVRHASSGGFCGYRDQAFSRREAWKGGGSTVTPKAGVTGSWWGGDHTILDVLIERVQRDTVQKHHICTVKIVRWGRLGKNAYQWRKVYLYAGAALLL